MGLLAFYYCASVKRTIRLHEDMQKARHGGMLGSGFITFSCWFLKILFTLLKSFVKQMAFFLCYSYSVIHICFVVYRNHEVLPKPQMREELNYKCNNKQLNKVKNGIIDIARSTKKIVCLKVLCDLKHFNLISVGC